MAELLALRQIPIPIFQISSLFYIKAFESVVRYSDDEDEETPAGA